MTVAKWPWWHQQTGPDDYRIRELLRAILDLHAYYGDTDTWLWRGQANASHNFEAAMHTRIVKGGLDLSNANIVDQAEHLIENARTAHLDVHEGTALPDLALLAMLQHYGAATPLLDVSLDPLVALYMAVVSPNESDDAQDGALFAIRRPHHLSPELSVRPFDSRAFSAIYDSLPDDRCVLYAAPDVSERLRIQRGYFLLSKLSANHERITLPLTMDTGSVTETWLARRMTARGSRIFVPPTSDIGVFRITAKFKAQLRDWLEQRTGLTRDFVYPTAWHQPHLEMFASSHGRLGRL